jgi:two-component sensor histidine kinase
MPQFHSMVADSDAELRAFGAKAKEYDIRLSFHPSQYVLPNSPNPELTKKSIWDLSSQGAGQAEDRFVLSGPDVTIGPRATLALTLMLHELTTNTAKYGALTARDGKVSVTWAVRRNGERDVFKLKWAERGGPPAEAPPRKGFGSRIIRTGLTGSGGVELRYDIEGMSMRATAPLYQIQEA